MSSTIGRTGGLLCLAAVAVACSAAPTSDTAATQAVSAPASAAAPQVTSPACSVYPDANPTWASFTTDLQSWANQTFTLAGKSDPDSLLGITAEQIEASLFAALDQQAPDSPTTAHTVFDQMTPDAAKTFTTWLCDAANTTPELLTGAPDVSPASAVASFQNHPAAALFIGLSACTTAIDAQQQTPPELSTQARKTLCPQQS